MSNRDFTKEDVKGYECVFSTYTSNKMIGSDALVIKENIHLKDGRVIPNVRVRVNEKWPFYITRKGFQNHKDHKEYEKFERVEKRMSTRIDLVKNVGNALHRSSPRNSIKDLADSPYLYGVDISPGALMKSKYMKAFPDCQTMSYRVAGLDIETDVVDGTEAIIMVNITERNRSYTAVTKQFVKNRPNFIENTYAEAKRLIPNDIKDMDWVIEIVDTPAQAVVKTIEKAHEWKPDFISIWNMSFDIPYMEKALLAEGYDPADVFSDPKVPPEFRYFRWKQGPAIKKTHDGKTSSIHIADRWHVVTATASFYFLDAMCLRKRIRPADGNEPSYKLNAILKTEGLETKLSIEELKDIEDDGDVWHYEMQKNYPEIYTVYNFIDDKRLVDYDDKTGDISRAFPALAGVSDYSRFHQNPRRIADDLHFFYGERGMIVGSTSAIIDKDPLNKMVHSLVDWIVTLPSYMIQNGLQVFDDAPNLRTMFFQYLSDLDIASTYPTVERICNLSKETTKFEVSALRGFSNQQLRTFTLDLTGGKSNALDLCIRYLGYPTPDKFLEDYQAFKQEKSQLKAAA